MYFVFLWILFSMIKVGEASKTVNLSLFDFFYKSIWVKSKLSSTSSMSIFWVIHLVKLMAIKMITIHRHYQSIDIILILKLLFDLLAEEAFARCSGTCYTNKWHFIGRLRQLIDFFCNLQFHLRWVFKRICTGRVCIFKWSNLISLLFCLKVNLLHNCSINYQLRSPFKANQRDWLNFKKNIVLCF